MKKTYTKKIFAIITAIAIGGAVLFGLYQKIENGTCNIGEPCFTEDLQKLQKQVEIIETNSEGLFFENYSGNNTGNLAE